MKALRTLFRMLRRILWALIVGFMVAWHNVYKQDDMLRNDTHFRIEAQEEDKDEAE